MDEKAFRKAIETFFKELAPLLELHRKQVEELLQKIGKQVLTVDKKNFPKATAILKEEIETSDLQHNEKIFALIMATKWFQQTPDYIS